MSSESKTLTLETALDTLRNIEDQYEPCDIRPPEELVAEVTAFLRRLYELTELPVTIEAMPEGDIVLSISPNRYDMLFMHCDTDGSAYCMVKLNNERSTRTYQTLASLPDASIERALRGISKGGD